MLATRKHRWLPVSKDHVQRWQCQYAVPRQARLLRRRLDGVQQHSGFTLGCSVAYPLDQCVLLISIFGSSHHTKYTGSCPAVDDEESEECFSRETEACRILDTSVTPSAAFRACFDEPAPTVAERVKMTALAGGDYVLSAGKELAYEFTRVIVNQHKLSKARRSTSIPARVPSHPPHSSGTVYGFCGCFCGYFLMLSNLAAKACSRTSSQ